MKKKIWCTLYPASVRIRKECLEFRKYSRGTGRLSLSLSLRSTVIRKYRSIALGIILRASVYREINARLNLYRHASKAGASLRSLAIAGRAFACNALYVDETKHSLFIAIHEL